MAVPTEIRSHSDRLAQIRDCDLKILINEFLPTHSNVG
jgi:hypothetical protein